MCARMGMWCCGAAQGALLRELLAASRDYGTLLGGGGPGARGALHALVPDASELRRLLESVAYECQVGRTHVLTLPGPLHCASIGRL